MCCITGEFGDLSSEVFEDGHDITGEFDDLSSEVFEDSSELLYTLPVSNWSKMTNFDQAYLVYQHPHAVCSYPSSTDSGYH